MSNPILPANCSQAINHTRPTRPDSPRPRHRQAIGVFASRFGCNVKPLLLIGERETPKRHDSFPCTDTFLRWSEIRGKIEPDSMKALWSDSMCSENIFIQKDPRFLCRHPVVAMTDVALSQVSFTRGIHIIEIKWPLTNRGTHAVLGVALKNTIKQHYGNYINLLGIDEKSWGWDLKNNRLLHDSQHSPIAESYPKNPPPFYQAPEEIRCILNMNRGVLGFETEGHYHGDAFTGLTGKQLHIAISTVWGHAVIGIQYTSGINESGPLGLQSRCKQVIRENLRFKDQIEQLPLPNSMKKWLAI